MSEQPIRVEYVVLGDDGSLGTVAASRGGAEAFAEFATRKTPGHTYRALPGPFVLVREAEWVGRDEALRRIAGHPCSLYGKTQESCRRSGRTFQCDPCEARAALQPREEPKR